MRIKIGLFIDTFYPMIDGVVTVVDNYARIMSKYAKVYVFAPNTGKYDDTKLPYKVIRCKSKKVKGKDYRVPIPKLDKKFMKELENIDLDVVHIHSPFTMGKLGIEYAKKNNKVLIGTIHSQYKQDFLRNTKSKILSNILTSYVMNLYRRCDVCYTVNEGIEKIVLEEYKLNRKLLIAKNATTMELSKDIKKSRKRINELHNLKDTDNVFLFVGRLNKLKNIFLIVDSLNKIKDKINFKMLFVGTGQDEKELKNKIKEYNLEDRIILCGKISDRELLRDYYTRSDLFLFPSLYDASSVVQVEAASQKTPTLFLKEAATAANIIDNHNGYLTDEDNYSNKIIEILSDKNKYKEVCENVYKELYITWDNEVKKVYDKYIEVLKEK